MPSDEQMMDTDQVAHYLKLNRRTVLKMAERGELPGVKVGKQWRYRRSDIDRYLDDKREHSKKGGSQ
jgi:excisionase family DNA binding protein